jgi:hypothetical protein
MISWSIKTSANLYQTAWCQNPEVTAVITSNLIFKYTNHQQYWLYLMKSTKFVLGTGLWMIINFLLDDFWGEYKITKWWLCKIYFHSSLPERMLIQTTYSNRSWIKPQMLCVIFVFEAGILRPQKKFSWIKLSSFPLPLQSSTHSVHTNVDSNNHMIIFTNKNFRLVNMG